MWLSLIKCAAVLTELSVTSNDPADCPTSGLYRITVIVAAITTDVV